MEDEPTPRLVTGLKARAHDGRSKLYRYLRREHRLLSATIAKHDPSWASIAAEVAGAGVMGSNNKPASPDALRLMWKRVCRDVEEEKAAKAQRLAAEKDRGVHPSRLPATWKPTPIETTPARASSRLAPPTNTDSAPAAPIELSEAARARLAALDRRLEWRDRHVNPPKRKD